MWYITSLLHTYCNVNTFLRQAFQATRHSLYVPLFLGTTDHRHTEGGVWHWICITGLIGLYFWNANWHWLCILVAMNVMIPIMIQHFTNCKNIATKLLLYTLIVHFLKYKFISFRCFWQNCSILSDFGKKPTFGQFG